MCTSRYRGRYIYIYIIALLGLRELAFDWLVGMDLYGFGSAKPGTSLLLGRTGPEVSTNHRQLQGSTTETQKPVRQHLC
jgi:hypothetical protein